MPIYINGRKLKPMKFMEFEDEDIGDPATGEELVEV